MDVRRLIVSDIWIHLDSVNSGAKYLDLTIQHKLRLPKHLVPKGLQKTQTSLHHVKSKVYGSLLEVVVIDISSYHAHIYTWVSRVPEDAVLQILGAPTVIVNGLSSLSMQSLISFRFSLGDVIISNVCLTQVRLKLKYGAHTLKK